MNLLIAGGSGFIGRHLIAALQPQYNITVIGRDWNLLKQCFPNNIQLCTWENLADLEANSFDVVINLCGQNISATRWNKTVKQELIESRVKSCTALIEWAQKQKASPRFYFANAIGIYGMQSRDDLEALDEDSPIAFDSPCDFLSEIGVRWQKALQPAVDLGMKVTVTRFGVVLKKGEGMLKKLSPSFYTGLGAILGDGEQVISWIHIDDLIAAYLFLLQRPHLTGVFNMTAPNPVSQAQFAHCLGKAMHRPVFLKIPRWVVQGVFGEMGNALLLHGQRVVPKRLLNEGYHFHYPKLHEALAYEFANPLRPRKIKGQDLS